MTELQRIWAGWRNEYVSAGANEGESPCVFCRIAKSDRPDEETYVIAKNADVLVVLNAFPYVSGHVLIVPVRHVGALDELEERESIALWSAVTRATRAIGMAYEPGGLNIGFNLGSAAGAGIPQHLHAHALPRWNGDTNFMTSVANTRVLPEALERTWERLNAAWQATAGALP